MAVGGESRGLEEDGPFGRSGIPKDKEGRPPNQELSIRWGGLKG